MLRENIGLQLRKRRKELEFSTADIAEKLTTQGIKVAEKSIYNWETGLRQPDADAFLILCKIYKIENILQYFGFSPESDDLPNPVTKDDEKIIKKYHDLDDRGKEAVLDTLEREHKHVEPKVTDAAM